MHNLDLRYSWPWSNNDNVVVDDDDIENVAPKNAILQNIIWPTLRHTHPATPPKYPNDRESG